MNPQDFCYWLDGYLFTGGPLTEEEVNQIKQGLAGVLATKDKVAVGFPFYPPGVRGAHDGCYSYGYTPISCTSDPNPPPKKP